MDIVAYDLQGGQTTLTSAGRALDAPAVGRLNINLLPVERLSEDGQNTLTMTAAFANTDDITDGNALYANRVFTYQWYAADRTAIPAETGQFYNIPPTIHAEIVAGNEAPWVEAHLHDALGNSVAFRATIGLVDVDIGFGSGGGGLSITSGFSDPAGVASSFSYQWLAAAVVNGAESGAYTPISGETGSVYVLARNYYETITRPFVRLSASFALSGGGNMALLSPPVNVLLLSGAVTLRGDGGAYGAVYTADVSGLRDAAGSAPAGGAFAYEWYASAAPGAREFASGGGRLEVSGAAVSLATYTLTPGVDVAPNPGFDVTLKRGGVGALGFADIVLEYLRVTLSHKSSGYKFVAAVAESASAVPNEPTEGAAYTVRLPASGIRGDGNNNDGTIFEIITTGITDGNGLGKFTWYWIVDNGDGRPFSDIGGTGSKYTLKANKPLVSGSPYHVIAAAAHRDAFGFQNDQAQIEFRLPGLNEGQGFDPEVPFIQRNVDVAFVITMSLNAPPTGQPLVEFLGTDISVGTTLSVNVDGITDVNDATKHQGKFSYDWYRKGTRVVGMDRGLPIFVLADADVTAINDGDLEVRVVYTDGFGFPHTFAPLLAQELRLSLSVNLSTREVTPVLENPGEVGSVTSYQWTRYNGDGSSPVVQSQTSSVYTLPVDTDKPLLALRINYTNAAGDARIAVSPQLRVAGAIFAASSTINITAATAAGVRAGVVWRASTNVRDLFGDAPSVEDIAYQWQSNTATTGGGWRTVGGNSPAYTVQAADFANNAENFYLRLRVTDAAGFSNTRLTSRVVNLLSVLATSPLVGGVTLSGANSNFLGGVLTVDASAIASDNGLASIVGYQLQHQVTLLIPAPGSSVNPGVFPNAKDLEEFNRLYPNAARTVVWQPYPITVEFGVPLPDGLSTDGKFTLNYYGLLTPTFRAAAVVSSPEIAGSTLTAVYQIANGIIIQHLLPPAERGDEIRVAPPHSANDGCRLPPRRDDGLFGCPRFK